jgi:hypothetical protein
MRRRAFVGAGLSLAGAALLPAQRAARANAISRVRPGQPGWLAAADWAKLGAAVGGRLAPVTVPDLTGPDAKALLGNPFYLADQPGLPQRRRCHNRVAAQTARLRLRRIVRVRG